MTGIARQYGVSVAQLIALNGLPSTAIVPGQALLIPVNSLVAGVREPITMLGFLELTGSSADRVNASSYAPYNTYLALFGQSMTEQGNLATVQAKDAVSATWAGNSVPAAVFSNWVGSQFSQSAIHTLLTSPTIRAAYIEDLIRFVQNEGYAAVVLDFESILLTDRDMYSAFVADLANQLRRLNIPLVVAVMPITGREPSYDAVRAYDYANIGRNADFVIIMAYNWSWGTGRPGPIAPLSHVEENIRYATVRIPQAKILLGIIRYGYDWTLPHTVGESANTLAVEDVVSIAMAKQVPIHWDATSRTPWMQYADASGVAHIVWFEDARSLHLKLQLIRKYRLAGIAAWQLGQTFFQFWPLVTNQFSVRSI